jgi:purine-binding chemotaxis protein CheW
VSETRVPILWCRIGSQAYGLHIAQVIEVAAMVAFASLPEASSTVRGLVNRRGEVLPLVDLRPLFDAPMTPLTPETLFIVVQGVSQKAGLVVDEVYQVKYWSVAQMMPAPRTVRFIEQVAGDGAGLIQIIALDALLFQCLNRHNAAPDPLV